MEWHGAYGIASHFRSIRSLSLATYRFKSEPWPHFIFSPILGITNMPTHKLPIIRNILKSALFPLRTLATYHITHQYHRITKLYAIYKYITNHSIIVCNRIKCATFLSPFLVLALISCSAKYRWTKFDYAIATTFVATQAGDGYTTDRIVNHNDGYEKVNTAILGKHPSTERIIIWKAGSTILILGVAHVAPVIHPKLRKVILGVGTISAGYWTWQNYEHLKDID
jgi:hypothetical protein